MIALANLVVVAHHAYTACHVRKPIFEFVSRAGHRFWNLPKNQLGKRGFGKGDARANELDSLHVGNNANTSGLLSSEPTATDPMSHTPVRDLSYASDTIPSAAQFRR